MPVQRKTGTNLSDVQSMNRSLIIRLLHKNAGCSRTDLARLTGLKQATITYIVNDLMEVGLIKETGNIETARGRRSIGLRLEGELFKVIGLRLARKYIEVGLFDIGSNQIFADKVRIGANDTPRQVMSLMRFLVEDSLKKNSGGTILGIGVALPGPLYRSEGRIALMTEFAGWEDINIAQELKEAFHYPVYVEHDANCGALAEWLYGSHNCGDGGTQLYVAAGQGIGAGIILAGSIYRGSLGTAGEIGHMVIAYDGLECECGNRGCLEKYCSTLSLLRYVDKEAAERPETVLRPGCNLEDVFCAMRQGDGLALQAVRRTGEFLAVGLSSVANILNPDSLIIGDDLSFAGKFFLDCVKNKLKELLLPQIYDNMDINLCSFDYDPVLLGASALAADEAFGNPALLFSGLDEGGSLKQYHLSAIGIKKAESAIMG